MGALRIRFLLLALLSFSSLSLAAGRCGFVQLMEQNQNAKHGLSRTLAKRGTCTASALYDSVYVDTTSHFRIFYTTTGPHSVTGSSSHTVGTPAYIDTLAHWLEAAYTLHTASLGMKIPKGPVKTLHYLDSRFPDKYPVEVIDIGLLRNTWDDVNGLGGPCAGCYGLTMPAAEDHSLSVLLIENDFRYQNANDPLSTWTLDDGGTCTYTESEHPIATVQNGSWVDYTEDWNTALKVTAFHELYHACQLRYQDYNDQYHFWFEASAVGVEELGAPEVNDYMQYLGPLFQSPQYSLFDIDHDGQMRPYGQGIFHKYLIHRFGLKFDPQIWSLLESAPRTSISKHFETFAKSKGEADFASLYHDYALHLVPSGDRSLGISSDSLWAEDLPNWPTLDALPFRLSNLPSDSFAFALFDWSSARNYTPEENSSYQKSVFSMGGQDYVLVSSGKRPNSSLDPTEKMPSLAFPNPWRGKSDLCFQLSGKSTKIEIRDGTGNITTSIQRDTLATLTCFDGISKGKRLAPGLYRWRGNRESALHKLLVIR